MVTPSDLGEAGRQFWDGVTAVVDLVEFGEAERLAEACRTLDELARINEAMRDAPLVVAGSAGQDRGNPLLAELRAHRRSFREQVASLKLPSPDEEEQAKRSEATSRAARRAVRARWDRRGAA